MNQLSARGLPLLIIVEGENDICFLKGMSQILRHARADLPDLYKLEHERRLMFLPTGGSNLADWVSRLISLHKLEFYLFDRELEPDTAIRRQAIEPIRSRPSCFAALTSKRTVENYLHPSAIREACGVDLAFDDDTDVPGLLALKLMERSGQSSWRHLAYKRQRRLHEKAKKLLNLKAVQHMTPTLLAQTDTVGEVIGWLRTIGQMIDGAVSNANVSDRELATILAALRHWQQDLAASEDGPFSEHFNDHTPLTTDEIDYLCERLNSAA